MRRRDLLLALTTVAFAGTARASAPSGGASPAGQNIDLAPVALPVVFNGRVVNYVFLNIRINLSPGADVARFRAREPYLRDALVRAAHRTPFTVPSDYTRINEARVRAVLMQQAGPIAGPRAIASIVFTSQMPRTHYGLPRPAAARGAAIVP
jgi:hypothetical protein